MPNIEIKARCTDLDKAREVARQHHTGYLGVLHQVDTYFFTKSGRLKLREINGKIAQLIPYSKDYTAGPMRSDYALLPVDNPDNVKGLLSELLGVEFVVDKKREVFLIENVRIHLDAVKDLGTFIEFEAVCSDDSAEERAQQTTKVNELMHVFGIKSEDLLERSYVDYLAVSKPLETMIPYDGPAACEWRSGRPENRARKGFLAERPPVGGRE